MTPILSKFYALLNDYKPLNVNRFGNIPFNGLSYYLPASLVIQPQGNIMIMKPRVKNQFILSCQINHVIQRLY